VRSLAKRSAEAAREIKTLISASVETAECMVGYIEASLVDASVRVVAEVR
jgi:methyl-accepting chemotaxis protein